jgi:hypothetical protein
MTTLTQKIPNLLRGISQQPDVKKFPGEVRDCVNAFPEYALGLMKRPGAKLEAPLRRAATPSGSLAVPAGQTAVTRRYGATEKWFDINIDGVPYIGQLNDFNYGLQGTIVGGSGYTNGTYNGVALTGGTGSSATANITVSGNAVTAVTMVNQGSSYTTGDVLSAADANLGGGGGSSFTFTLTNASNATDNHWLSINMWFKDSGVPRAVNLDNYMAAMTGVITGGSGYTNGTYNNVALTGGNGSNATANITVSGGAVTAVAIVNQGTGYRHGDSLSAADANLGGGGGSSFAYVVSFYISGGDWAGLQTAIDNEVADLNAKITGLSTFQTAQKAYYTEYLKTVDQLTDLFAIDTTYTNGEVKQFVNSAVLVDAAGNEDYMRAGNTMTGTIFTTDTTVGDVIFKTGEFREGSDAAIAYKKGVEKTSEYPILMDSFPTGYKLYELLKVDKATDEDETDLGGTPTTTYNTAQTTYDTLVTTYNTEVTDTDNNYPTFNTTIQPINGTDNYFRDDTSSVSGAKVDLSEVKIFQFQDTVFVLNPKKAVQYTSATTTAEDFTEGFVFFKVLSDGDFTVNITLLLADGSGNVDSSFGSSGTITGTATHSSSNNTVAELRTLLNTSLTSAYSDFGTNFDFEQSGNGIYIRTKSALNTREFELTVSGPTDNSISTLRHDVNRVSDLPLQLRNNYKVKVINSLDVNADDMYLVFETEDGNDYSTGTWVETNGFGLKTALDKNTLPHALTVNSNGSFSFGPWTGWEDRLVGDEVTNPTPSFVTLSGGVNKYIKDMFVYRNRLGFLTEDHVSLSRAGEFFNFFVKSAVASGDDDPIDISVSDSDSPSLNYVSQETAGLLLYGKTGQYLLATDSDILSPTTAKINKVAGFEADMGNTAISLGSTTAFVSKTQSTTKLFELLKVNALEPPQSVEQTRTVPELVPTTVNSIVGSPDVGLVSFGTVGETTLFHFSYLRMGGQELSRSWYKWELPGTLLHQFFDGNEFHCIIKTNQSETAVVSFDVAQSSTDGVLTLESGKKTDLVLDLYDDKPFFIYRGIISGTFENKTRVFLPLNKLSNEKLVIVMYSNRSQVFDEDTVTLTEATDATHGRYVEVDGDWRGSDVFIGYKYNMSVELPRIYYKQARQEQVDADVEAELIIHKLKVKTGLTGPIDYKINIIGIPVRTSTLTVTPVGQYNLNSVNMTESAVHHVPVYQRNHNTTITIESNTAFPATVESINWEGRYATNYYRRA